MNESTLVPREEISDLDWLARNVHEWPVVATFKVSLGWHGCRDGDPHYVRVDYGDEITKEQWLYRRAELQNKQSWNDAPEWADWLAQDTAGLDGIGAWWWYRTKPTNGDRTWSSKGHSSSPAPKRGEVLGDWRDTLEKRPEQVEFEPFVSVEDAATAKQPAITASKYTKTIHGVSVDVYDVLQAWGVSNPALQHLIKKALQCGLRGHKDNAQDLQDIIDSAIRAKELEC